MAKKPKEDATELIDRSANQKRSPRTSQSDGPIRSVHQGQVNRTDQSVAFTKKTQGALLVQSDSSSRSTRRTPRHTRQKHRLSQSKGFGASFDHPSRRNCWLSQSHQLVRLSSDGLSLDGSSFGRSVGSANHILRSDYLRTDFLRNQSETLKIDTSHEWSRTVRVTRSRSPTLVRHVIKKYGRKRRKKSLYAQNPYVYVHIKSLYAQKLYVCVRIKSLYAQKPYVYVRIKLL